MNTNLRLSIEQEIVDQAILCLKELLNTEDIKINEPQDPSYDFNVDILGDKFICEVKTNVTNANFGMILYQLQQLQQKYDFPVLLVARHIALSLLPELRRNNINTLDVSGNSSIMYNSLVIMVKGEKAVRQPIELTKPGRLFKDAGLKLLFGLLTNPDMINYTYREMQNHVNLSLGAIKNVLEEMSDSGFLLKNGNKRILKKKSELIMRWVTSYNETLKPKLFLKRMSLKDNASWKDITLPNNTYWGGEAASNLINGYLIPEDFTVYTEQKTGQLARIGLRPDDNGSVFVYEKFWKSDTAEIFAPKLLVYADLMGSRNGRNIEAAQKLFENGI